ncbi:hypothetical protein PR048_014890 [Dryococelus australis]|uniref:DUF4371 domain-containing protein n=1 Tax=Dryococelus australis TaxID=614101 RepID=A0ABQ9HFF6_9NEOP|nr:hypothetical protein PR048_014890 [Dryococelus australis]
MIVDDTCNLRSTKNTDASKVSAKFLPHISYRNMIKVLLEQNVTSLQPPAICGRHAKPWFKIMFPDSKKGQKPSVNISDIVKSLQSGPFSLSTDGSNNQNDCKLYPLTVTFFSEESDNIVTLLLSVVESANNTGDAIFKGVNCLSFGCDNANTMVEKFKGAISFLKQQHLSMIV